MTRFLTKLLTEDLPRLFVRPKKIVLDFQKGTALGPVSDDFKTDAVQEGNKDFVGELSVTLVDARKLAYVIFGIHTFPYFFKILLIARKQKFNLLIDHISLYSPSRTKYMHDVRLFKITFVIPFQ